MAGGEQEEAHRRLTLLLKIGLSAGFILTLLSVALMFPFTRNGT